MRTKGYTLLELLYALIIIAVLFILSIQSTSYLMRKNEQQVLIDELSTIIEYARIQAVTLGHPIYLSPVESTLNWSKGAKLTEQNKKTHQMDLLYQWNWHYLHWNVIWKGVDGRKWISFSNNPMKAISNGKFVLTNMQTKEEKVLILNRLGRTKSVN